MKFLIKKTFIKCLFVVSLFLLGITDSFAAEFNFSGNVESPFPNNANNIQSGDIFGQPISSSRLVYRPFELYNFQSYNNQTQFFDPVLYGPGGDPIGGLPVGEGIYALFFGVLAYCIYKVGCKVYYVRIMNRDICRKDTLED
jgi:hypothetical protein